MGCSPNDLNPDSPRYPHPVATTLGVTRYYASLSQGDVHRDGARRRSDQERLGPVQAITNHVAIFVQAQRERVVARLHTLLLVSIAWITRIG